MTLRILAGTTLAGTILAAAATLPVASSHVPGVPDDAVSEPNVLDVRAVGRTSFEIATAEIAAGWTTLRFVNASEVVHFVLVERMPVADGEQKTVADSRAEVVPVFQNIMDDINGRAPRFPDLGFELPSWYGDVGFLGGPGLTSPGETGEVTLDLEPGTYVLECYVKMPDGTFHSTAGMIEGLVVTERGSGTEPLSADGRVTVSRQGGIEMDGPVEAGRRTLAVHFTDQAAYEHHLGHDVHLIHLEEDVDLEALGAWMDWSAPGGLAEPAPSGVTFLGGTQDMPPGSTAYVTAELSPGDYAWIAEVPSPGEKGMLTTFSVR